MYSCEAGLPLGYGEGGAGGVVNTITEVLHGTHPFMDTSVM